MTYSAYNTTKVKVVFLNNQLYIPFLADVIDLTN